MGNRKQVKALVQRLGSERVAAYDDARRLALQIAAGGPRSPVDLYSYGLILNEGERPYRVFWIYGLQLTLTQPCCRARRWSSWRASKSKRSCGRCRSIGGSGGEGRTLRIILVGL
jgi:hypothetical protein